MAKIESLVFVDIETTGHDVNADPPTDATVEIAAVKVDLRDRRSVHKFQALIRPWGEQTIKINTGGRPAFMWDLGKFHQDHATFAGEDWTRAIPLEKALEILAGHFLTPGATVAGQNVPFDLRYLRRDFALANVPWPKLDYHVIDICPAGIFLQLAGKVDGLSLRHTAPWARNDPQYRQSHRAMADVEDEIRVFWAMYDYYTQGIKPEQGALPFRGWEGRQP